MSPDLLEAKEVQEFNKVELSVVPSTSNLSLKSTTKTGEQHLKVLICGDVEGNLVTLHKTLQRIKVRQGHFDLLFCCGNFFGDDCLLDPAVLNLSDNNAFTSAAEVPKFVQTPSTSELFEIGSEQLKLTVPTDATAAGTDDRTSNSLADNSSSPKTAAFNQPAVHDPQQPSSVLSNLDLLAGKANFPVLVYFIDSSASQMGEFLRLNYSTGCSLSSTLHFVGAFGFTQIHGLNVGFVSGCYDAMTFFDEAEDEENITITEELVPIDSPLRPSLSSPEFKNKGLGDFKQLHRCSSNDVHEAIIAAPVFDENSAPPVSTAETPYSKQTKESTDYDQAEKPLEFSHQQHVSDETQHDEELRRQQHSSIATSFTANDLRRYFAGSYSRFYCHSILQRFKAISGDHIGKVDLFLSCEWPASVDEALKPEQKDACVSLLNFGRQQPQRTVTTCGVSTAEAEALETNEGAEDTGAVGKVLETQDASGTSELLPMSPAISELVELLEPRYHLAGGCGIFYKRPIYRTSANGFASKFIGLGKVPTSMPQAPLDIKLKFVHSLKLKPISVLSRDSLLATPVSSTPSPYFTLYNPHSIAKHQQQQQSAVLSKPQSPISGSPPPLPSAGEDRLRHSSSQSPEPPPPLEYYDASISHQRIKRIRTLSNDYYAAAAAESNDVAAPPSPLNSSSPCSTVCNDEELITTQRKYYINNNNNNNSNNSNSSNNDLPDTTARSTEIDSNISSPLSNPSSPSNFATTSQPSSPYQHQSGSAKSEGSAGSDSNFLCQHMNSVMVTNIAYEVNIESFMHVMQSFGKIIHLNFPRTPDGRSTGRVWITYESLSSAEKAVSASEHLECNGRTLRIQYSTQQQQQQQHLHNHIHPLPSNKRRITIGDGGGVGGEEPSNSLRNPRFSHPNSRRGLNQQTQPRKAPQAIDVRCHSDCWFCLENPKAEKRLIVSMRQKVYLTLAKGGLVNLHVLIIPLTHYPNFVFCPPDVGFEIENYINALRSCYRSQDMELILYERYFPMKATTGMHMQLQAIPIPRIYASKSMQLFSSRAARSGASFEVFDSNESISSLRRRIPDPINQTYFYVELPGETHESIERWLYSTDAVASPSHQQQLQRILLPFNFGREAAAALMEVPHRSNWQNCVQPENAETQLAKQFQKVFKPFEPI